MADLKDYIAVARRILVFTGAGVSTRSGIPDYRGPQGTWTKRQPTTLQAFLASDAGRRDYWDYKLEAWDEWRDAEPNATHHACVELERAGRLAMVVTQNVDGLHAKAGTSPGHLVELHGTNSAVGCLTCGRRSDPEKHFEAFRATGEPPVCDCGGWLKPATISFGQSLVESDVERARDAALACDLVIALGSTLAVYPAAGIPLVAANRGTPYVIVNMGETDHDGLDVVTLRLDGDVSEIFPRAVTDALGEAAIA